MNDHNFEIWPVHLSMQLFMDLESIYRHLAKLSLLKYEPAQRIEIENNCA